MQKNVSDAGADFSTFIDGRRFSTILADPPWQFQNRTGKIAPEHKRLARYGTMDLKQIKGLPVSSAARDTAAPLSLGPECPPA